MYDPHLSVANVVYFRPSQPLISKVRAAIEVDRGDDLHVGYIESDPRSAHASRLTLTPFASAERYLALDELENVELQEAVLHAENTLEHSLDARSVQFPIRM
jgi:hypothetical protein